MDIPETWEMVTLSDITTDAEQRQPAPDEGFVYIDISSVNRETKRIESPQNLLGKEAPSRARKAISVGDVLVSMTRPNLNAVALVPLEYDNQIASTGFDVLRAFHVDPRWIFYAVRSNDFIDALSDLVQGALYPAVRSKDVRGYVVPLAPFNEQKRIADKLDALLTQLGACRERLERVPVILKRFRQTVLDTAISGKLTEQWREDHNAANESYAVHFEDDSIAVPITWKLSTINDVIDPKRPLCYGVVQPGPEVEGGMCLIRVQDLDRSTVLVENLRTISADVDLEFKRSRVQHGDLLISVVGTIGRTAIVPSGIEANIARAIARIACKKGVDPQWVNIWLSSRPLQWWLIQSAREVARKTLNLSDLAKAQVAIPPIEEQHEIVRRIESLFAYANALEARYHAAREQLNRLTPAILSKAFRGELIPQDPNDEPASALLEHIRAERAATAKEPTKRTRRTGMSKSTSRKKPDNPIAIVDALREAGREVSGEELLIATGYANDADTGEVEAFMVAVRDALQNNQIAKVRRDSEDWFSLVNA